MTRLAREHPALASEGMIGSDLPFLTVSWVPEAERGHWPALLLVAGIEPNDLTGPVCAVTTAEALVAAARTNETTRRILASASVLIVPRVASVGDGEGGTPGGLDEPAVTRRPPVDDDHDGLMDEDGTEDLNGDGRVTSMRVEDSAGGYAVDPVEGRLLVAVDRARGESGAWRWLSEGRDDDGDEEWNEDGPGGVNPNRNFPAGYRFFERGAGVHPLSEPATRALAEFVVARPNIAAAFTWGAADNLTETPKGEPGGKRPATAVHEADVPWLAELGKGWRRAVRLEKTQPGVALPGTFSDWMYFHRGRLSLAARPWFPALAMDFTRPVAQPAAKGEGGGAGPAATAPGAVGAGDPGEPGSGPGSGKEAAKPVEPAAASGAGESAKKPADRPGREEDKRNEADRAYLRWLDTHAPSGFVTWQRVEHPDFPNRVVEVGGFAPWIRSNPPASLLEELAGRQAGFVLDLVGVLPRIAIRRTEVKARGNGVFDVRVEVQNTGRLPTVPAHGEVTGEVLPSRITLLGPDDGAFLSGPRTQRFGPLPGGGGAEEVRWMILAPGRGSVDLEVVTALAGRARATLPLTEEPK
jgi:hypothetical protein